MAPDAAWPAAAAVECERLAVALRPWLAGPVEHIGSTSVPGLIAKPLLDLMAGVTDLAAAAAAVPLLHRLGYVHGPHRADALWFHGPGAGLHLTEPGSRLWRERLAFRDALRSDPALLAEYGALKQRMSSLELPAYTANKRGLVTRVLLAAGVELPPANEPVPVASFVRAALTGQWQVLADAAPTLAPATPTRLTGWRNAELLAHLVVQPLLLCQFLARPDPGTAELGAAVNLGGTRGLASLIDAAARAGAAQGRTDLTAAVETAVPVLLAADPARRITSLQGSITLLDYLRTRCVEAVVHGLDAAPPVAPEPAALTVAAGALLEALGSPEVVAVAADLEPVHWVEVATGRAPAPPELAAVLPVMG